MSGILHKPATVHACTPGWIWKPMREDGDTPPPFPDAKTGTPHRVADYPRGTVWECECGDTWVSRGPAPEPANLHYGPGMAPPQWKRESHRARRKRERRARPLDPGRGLFGAHTSGDTPYTELPKVSDRPAAGEFRLVDRDADGQPAGMIMLDPKRVDVVIADGKVIGYRYHGALLPCPAPRRPGPAE